MTITAALLPEKFPNNKSQLSPESDNTDKHHQHKFSRGEMIPLWSGIIWKIEKGICRSLTWSEEGTVITLGIWGPGDIIGRSLSKIEPYQIESLSRSEVSILPANFIYQASHAILEQIQLAQELLCIIRRERVHISLLELLIWLAKRFGKEIEEGHLLDLPMTHQELAEVIGTTRVTITRLFKQFEDEGIIKRHRRQLILCYPVNKNW